MEIETIRSQLRCAIHELSQRGLKLSAKWAAELAMGLPSETNCPTEEPTQSRLEYLPDAYALAKTYYDVGEYLRAADVLKDCQDDQSRFLHGYSLYLAGERYRDEGSLEFSAPTNRKTLTNSNLPSLYKELTLQHENGKLDGFGLYLFGIVLKAMGHTDESCLVDAKSILIASVKLYPWNWSAWLDLSSLCSDSSCIQNQSLANSCGWIYDFFQAHVLAEHHQAEAAYQILEKLSQTFTKSTYLAGRRGLARYDMRRFDLAHEEFETLHRLDPYRLESMDIYSNVLYVKECKAELSRLAHAAIKLDKYCPETCCIIGNYYSLKAQHEKALIYFQRALKLNREYLAAWTLIGHEYVELKNTNAAIEAYRRAVDINPHDFRAWYGLGQTYEILHMFSYALYYFRKATTLRPYDSRMWCALGGCYLKLDRHTDAIMCYERAISNKDEEGVATVQLAKLYKNQGSRENAAHYFRLHLEQRKSAEIDGQDTVEAILFMALYYKEERMLAQAAEQCSRLLDHMGPEKDEAKALLREIRNLESMETTSNHTSYTE